VGNAAHECVEHLTMATDYIPSRDADFDPFAIQFKTLIVASPTSYGLVAADGAAIADAVDDWHVAYLANLAPTRNHGTVVAKNNARANCKSVIRGYAAQIRANRAVSDALKVGLGLRIPDPPTPIPAPTSYPLLTIDSFNLGTLKLSAADQFTPDKKAKPAGTAGLLLFSIVAEESATAPTDADFNAFLTKTRFQNTFSQADSGKMVTYFGRWTNGKGELGPWSPPVSIRIAA